MDAPLKPSALVSRSTMWIMTGVLCTLGVFVLVGGAFNLAAKPPAGVSNNGKNFVGGLLTTLGGLAVVGSLTFAGTRHFTTDTSEEAGKAMSRMV